MSKPVDRRTLIAKLRRFGFTGPYTGGKHQFMAKGNLKLRVPNPHHAKDISPALLKEILRQAGIAIEAWDGID